MKKHLYIKGFILAFMLLMWLPGYAQQTYTLSGNQKFTVAGTSTIHDWKMASTKGVTGSAQLSIESGKLATVKSLLLTIPVNSLKSGKGSMDKNAYEALLESKYPTIKFELIEVNSITGNKVKAKGKLTVAGTSKIIPLEATYSINGNTVTFKGTHDVLFSDFKVDAPTAVFGTIKTGNELTLAFDASFSAKN